MTHAVEEVDEIRCQAKRKFTEFYTNTQKQAKLTVYCLENPTLVIINTMEMFFKQGTELSTVVTSRGEETGKKGRKVTQTTVLLFVSGYRCHDAASRNLSPGLRGWACG